MGFDAIFKGGKGGSCVYEEIMPETIEEFNGSVDVAGSFV
jgi:hypothetical protein